MFANLFEYEFNESIVDGLQLFQFVAEGGKVTEEGDLFEHHHADRRRILDDRFK